MESGFEYEKTEAIRLARFDSASDLTAADRPRVSGGLQLRQGLCPHIGICSCCRPRLASEGGDVVVVPSHWRDCHFADAPFTSLLKRLLKVGGGER